MADEELTIDFDLFGVPKGLTEIEKISKALEKLPAKVVVVIDVQTKQIAADMKRTIQMTASPSGRWSMQKGSSGPFADPMLNAQYQDWKRQRAQAKASALMQTNPTQIGGKSSTGYGVGSVASGNKSLGQAVKNAIFSTRFTANNGHIHFSPLIGRSMRVLAGMGPVGIAAGAAAGGLLLLHSAAQAASEVLNNLQSARYTAGATYAETGKLAGVGASLGMSAGDMAGMAREFGEALATNPQARAFGAAHGMSDAFGNNQFGGDLDKSKNFFKAVDYIMNAPNEADAIRAARAFGPNMEKLLGLRDMDQWRKDRMLAENAMYGPGDAKAAANYRDSVGHLTMAFDKLLIACTPLVDMFTRLLEVLQGPEPTAAEKKAAENNFNPFNNPYKAKSRKDAESEKHDAAMDAHTEAMWAQVRMTREVFGGGERARGAMPQNMRGQTWEQGMKANAIGLGAFGV